MEATAQNQVEENLDNLDMELLELQRRKSRPFVAISEFIPDDEEVKQSPLN